MCTGVVFAKTASERAGERKRERGGGEIFPNLEFHERLICKYVIALLPPRLHYTPSAPQFHHHHHITISTTTTCTSSSGPTTMVMVASSIWAVTVITLACSFLPVSLPATLRHSSPSQRLSPFSTQLFVFCLFAKSEITFGQDRKSGAC